MEPEQGNRRYQGKIEGVTEEHDGFDDALRARHVDVVSFQRLDQAGAERSHHDRGEPKGESESRKEEGSELLAERRAVSAYGENWPPETKKKKGQAADPKSRHARPENDQDPDERSRDPAAPQRGPDSEGNAEKDCQND